MRCAAACAQVGDVGLSRLMPLLGGGASGDGGSGPVSTVLDNRLVGTVSVPQGLVCSLRRHPASAASEMPVRPPAMTATGTCCAAPLLPWQPSYMDPEYLRTGRYGPKSDTYSLGE